MHFPNLDIICNKLGVLNRHREIEMVESNTKQSRRTNAQCRNPRWQPVWREISQKIVVGKWLARKSRVVIFDEPTRGIDVAAKVEIYNLMNELKREGIGVLFVSSEMTEIMGIADRIIVMCDGRITGELDSSNVSQEKILELATKFEDKIGNEFKTA